MVAIDRVERVSSAQTLAPSTYAAGQTGGQVDLANFASAYIVINAGAWTDGTHDFTVEEAADDGTGSPGTWAAVASGDLVGSTPTIDGSSGNTNQTHEVGYVGSKRFVRITTTTSGTTTGAAYGVLVVRGDARKQPV